MYKNILSYFKNCVLLIKVFFSCVMKFLVKYIITEFNFKSIFQIIKRWSLDTVIKYDCPMNFTPLYYAKNIICLFYLKLFMLVKLVYTRWMTHEPCRRT